MKGGKATCESILLGSRGCHLMLILGSFCNAYWARAFRANVGVKNIEPIEEMLVYKKS